MLDELAAPIEGLSAPPDLEQHIRFHPHSFGDPAGRLFTWQGDLYRGLRAEWSPILEQLIQTGRLERLVERKLLIDTTLTDLHLEGYAAVVKHRTIPFASYPEEWPAGMLQDAALTIIRLLKALAEVDLTLKDPHPWNLLFDSATPIYVDLTSIARVDAAGGRPRYGSFHRFCVYPLLLMEQGHERLARRLLWEYEGVRESDLDVLLRHTGPARKIRGLVERVGLALAQRTGWRRGPNTGYSRAARLSDLDYLERRVASVRVGGGRTGLMPGSITHRPGEPEAEDALRRVVRQLLLERRAASVLAIDSAAGGYPQMAAQFGRRVVAFEADSAQAMRLYNEARAQGLAILPLVMDFTDPTPARGLASHWAIAAHERFKCDYALAPTLLQRLVFERYLTFDQIAEGLAAFASRGAIVGFTLPQDPSRRAQSRERWAGYTVAHWVAALQTRFDHVRVIPLGEGPEALVVAEK